MRTEASPGGHNRPPIISAAKHGGASVRPTARVRPTIPVEHIARPSGFEPSHPYVRKFWVAALGPSAVAELLRLISAAAKGEEVRLPRYLPQLLRAGLVELRNGALAVVERVPPVPKEMRWRFSPGVSADHSRVLQVEDGADSVT